VASRSSEMNFTKNYTLLYLYFIVGHMGYVWYSENATKGTLIKCIELSTGGSSL